MGIARRAFATGLLTLVKGICQTRPKRLTEEDEWQDAYQLAKLGSPRPKGGFVPDAETAKRIAEAVARSQYGEDVASGERPFRARLRGETWTVLGTMNPPGILGGVAIIQIAKLDGRILFATHTE
jgi:hypothetical protein